MGDVKGNLLLIIKYMIGQGEGQGEKEISRFHWKMFVWYQPGVTKLDRGEGIDLTRNNAGRGLARPPNWNLPQFSVRCEALLRGAPPASVYRFKGENEAFPAQGTLLFQRRAEKFLDMECLAIIGWLLTDPHGQEAGLAQRSVR